MPWIRLYCETLHDPKMRRLPTTYKWIWIGLLLLAGESLERGKIYITEGIPYTNDDLANALDLDFMNEEYKEVDCALQLLKKLKMIDLKEDGIIEIINFDKRQYEYPSNHPAEVGKRVQKHRETRVKRECNERDTDTDTDTDTDILVEKEIFDYWNSQKNLIKHREFTDAFFSCVHSKLKVYTRDEICDAIESYDDILSDPAYLLEYKWKIDEFLKRKLEQFVADAKPHNFQPLKSGGKK